MSRFTERLWEIEERAIDALAESHSVQAAVFVGGLAIGGACAIFFPEHSLIHDIGATSGGAAAGLGLAAPFIVHSAEKRY